MILTSSNVMVGREVPSGVTVAMVRAGAAILAVSAAPANARIRAMSRSDLTYLKRIVRNLTRAGLPLELAALIVAAQMRAVGVPITEANLDAAFA
jgi:hypothetical protein